MTKQTPEAILTNEIKIESITTDTRAQIIKTFTFNNPKYQSAIRFGHRAANIEPTIKLFRYTDSGLVLPIGALNWLIANHHPHITDQRATASAIIPFNGTLRDYQARFIQQAIDAQGGQMIAATGSGKTVCGIALASRLKQRTLILVKSKDLAEQWQKAITQFTGLKAGQIGGGKNIEGEAFTIGLTQSLVKKDLPRFHYGLIIADECHNLPASQAYQVMNGLNARYKYGLSATPQRRDNLEFMIKAAIGGVCAEIKQTELGGNVLPVQVKTLQVSFEQHADSWADFLNVLVDDENRNRIIAGYAIKAAEKMGTIILCTQVRHCEILASHCLDCGMTPLVLHGQLPAKVREERRAKATTARLIIGTLSLLSEGIDLPHLSALIFASPVSAVIDKTNPAATRLIQSIGRCRRPYPGKKFAYILDIVDQCGFGVSAFNKRRMVYNRHGFKILA